MKSQLKVHSLSYAVNDNIILDNINVDLSSGKLIGIIGPNGAGKTSLLKALVGFLSSEHSSSGGAASGRIFFQRENLADVDVGNNGMQSNEIRTSYMPQFEFCHWDISVIEMLNISARHYISSKKQQALAIERVSEQFDITDLWHQKYQTLSGGQRSRVLIARSLINQPHWFFADEPIASLDIRYQHEILSLLRQFIDDDNEHSGCVLVLHDLNLAHQYCDEVIIMKNGACVAKGCVNDVMTDTFLTKTFDVPIISQVINREDVADELIDEDIIDDEAIADIKAIEKIRKAGRNKDKVIFIDGL